MARTTGDLSPELQSDQYNHYEAARVLYEYGLKHTSWIYLKHLPSRYLAFRHDLQGLDESADVIMTRISELRRSDDAPWMAQWKQEMRMTSIKGAAPPLEVMVHDLLTDTYTEFEAAMVLHEYGLKYTPLISLELPAKEATFRGGRQRLDECAEMIFARIEQQRSTAGEASSRTIPLRYGGPTPVATWTRPPTPPVATSTTPQTPVAQKKSDEISSPILVTSLMSRRRAHQSTPPPPPNEESRREGIRIEKRARKKLDQL